jgi:DNA recombination protein RmuC
MGRDYFAPPCRTGVVEQVHTVAGDAFIRPDMIVNMPDKRQLVVDVKTPLDAYLAAAEAENDAQRKLGLERHAKNVRAHMVINS